MRLVLESIGLSAQVAPRDDRWRVSVAEHQADLALEELTDYRREQTEASNIVSQTNVRFEKGIFESVLAFVCTLIAGSLAGWSSTGGLAWTKSGLSEASLVLEGQYWRSVTALTLHADLSHLLSNLFFGSLFLLLASKRFGGGVAVLLMVLGGALGNLLNALLRDASHASLGASTAVFAALGIIVASTLRANFELETSRFRRWTPLIAGGVLFAMFGTGGERTDLGAHCAGFTTGLMLGWLCSWLPFHWLHPSKVQRAAGVTTIAILFVAWILAVVSVG
ncbi:MAG: rhomboid family intramembrane serine protease [Planctomycetota bacterium]